MSTFLFCQNNKMNEQLQKLFLDLDLAGNPHEIAKKSKLKFESGTNRTVSWGRSDNISAYVASFDKNYFIESSIKKGILTIIPKTSDMKKNVFSLNERVWFYNHDDMQKEFLKICSIFEKFAVRVKNTAIQNENFEIISENTEIIFDTNHKLTIGYHLPVKNEKNKEYSIAFIYDN